MKNCREMTVAGRDEERRDTVFSHGVKSPSQHCYSAKIAVFETFRTKPGSDPNPR